MPLPSFPVLAGAGLLAGLVAVAASLPRPGPGPGAAGAAGPPRAVSAAPGPAVGTAVGREAGPTASPGPATTPLTGPVARSTRPSGPWRWPVLTTPRVVRGFAPPAQRWQSGHRGVDLSAVPGDVVVAAGSGIVTFAGPLAGRGVVTITHGPLRTTYEPVRATVAVGDVVDAGEPIGTIAPGASHCGGYPSCLHWGLLRGRLVGTVYLDPLSLLGASRPILLPIPNVRGTPG